jgi:penicillin amidase
MAVPRLTARLLKSSLPDVGRTHRLAGLEGPVTIHRDAHGIPHVRAQTRHDAFFGQGFCTAQDRLWQMDYDRRRAYGRWSEAIGPAGLEGDKQMRRFQIRRAVEGHYSQLLAPTRGMLEAYAEGVNAFIAGTGAWAAEFAALGIAPEPWEPVHCLAVFMVRHILMGVWEGKIWRARLLNHLGAARTALLHPGYAQGQLTIVPPGGEFHGAALDGMRLLTDGLPHITWMKEGVEAGSNNWVVGGARTKSGKPLLAGDPHRALDVPNVYYQNHVACDAFDVIGFTFPGVPGFPHFAHNAQAAWGITHGNGDYQDLYVERFDAAHPGRYEFQGKWLEAEISREPIRVRGQRRPEVLEVARTRHGPVIAGNFRSGAAIAFRYTATEAVNSTLDAVQALHGARSADGVEAAMRKWVDPVNNMVYCDVHGAFGYRTRGQVPVRAPDNAWLPVPGWDGRHEWHGTVPFDEMPAIRNPECGFAYTANNRIVDESYPHYIGLDYAPGFRAERLYARLRDATGLTGEDMAAIHADVESVPAGHWRPLYGRIPAAGPAEARLLELLRHWDGRVTRDSAAATAFHALRSETMRRVLSPLLGTLTAELFQSIDRGGNGLLLRVQSRLHTQIAADDRTMLPPGATWEQLLGQALTGAVENLRTAYGADPARWRWGDVHRTGPQHLLAPLFPQAAALLNPRPLSMGGDGDTVQAGGFYTLQGFQAQFISVARYTFDLADWNLSTWIVPGGASGHPGSPHYQDQGALYEAHRTLPMTYDWDRIAAEAATSQRLLPR